jgi:hypothetical protein
MAETNGGPTLAASDPHAAASDPHADHTDHADHADHADPDFMRPSALNTGIALVCAGGALLLVLFAIAVCRAVRRHRERREEREQQRAALEAAMAETSYGRV